ncbi:Uu.00g088920.m01.CDS01 [Anthostomella pinea]|uniref:Uu.00g088920.m01.CDS01 n=1 Tax=Anthostomella pinea TaxID=933095 RepID=A0AAI8VNJ1_9PEZI|nr:Uu.00g088920.m01.CDS01 [Anthostomella pinea]
MTPALRLTALSCAIGPVYGRWFPTGRDAVNWGPATRTAAIAEFDPAESTPTPTPAPGVQPLNADLRKRDESKASTCGFPVDDLSRAIVGGTVGGVAGLALIVVAILFLLYRRRRRNREPSAPVEHDYPHAGMVYEQAAPGSQYASTFYGEAPPGMVQTADQNFFGHPHDGYGTSTAMFARDDHSSGSPSFFIPGANPVTGLRPGPGPGPSKQQDDLVSPIEPSPVSHVSPSAQYNTMVSAITNLTPPPPQSDYSQFSPPPPQHYQSYRPYPGT